MRSLTRGESGHRAHILRDTHNGCLALYGRPGTSYILLMGSQHTLTHKKIEGGEAMQAGDSGRNILAEGTKPGRLSHYV